MDLIVSFIIGMGISAIGIEISKNGINEILISLIFLILLFINDLIQLTSNPINVRILNYGYTWLNKSYTMGIVGIMWNSNNWYWWIIHIGLIIFLISHYLKTQKINR